MYYLQECVYKSVCMNEMVSANPYLEGGLPNSLKF